jgi:hypothetical protein
MKGKPKYQKNRGKEIGTTERRAFQKNCIMKELKKITPFLKSFKDVIVPLLYKGRLT